jgi:hypothetical protein
VLHREGLDVELAQLAELVVEVDVVLDHPGKLWLDPFRLRS